MHRCHQRRHMLGRGILADTVAQIKNMRRPRARALVRRTEGGQYLGHFAFNSGGRGKKYIRVDIAL